MARWRWRCCAAVHLVVMKGRAAFSNSWLRSALDTVGRCTACVAPMRPRPRRWSSCCPPREKGGGAPAANRRKRRVGLRVENCARPFRRMMTIGWGRHGADGMWAASVAGIEDGMWAQRMHRAWPAWGRHGAGDRSLFIVVAVPHHGDILDVLAISPQVYCAAPRHAAMAANVYSIVRDPLNSGERYVPT